MSIKAIETVYKGYRFRSRLEARWAVYFDAIGLKWEYEKEGYDLDGLWYLPDFWLPQVGMFGEVKPEPFSASDLVKVTRLVTSLRSKCLLLVGVPECQSYDYIHSITSTDDEPHEDDWSTNYCMISMFHGFPLCYGRFYLTCDGSVTRDEFFSGYWNQAFNDIPPAVSAARQARFEHGESP